MKLVHIRRNVAEKPIWLNRVLDELMSMKTESVFATFVLFWS